MSGIGWDDYNDCPLYQFSEDELAERDEEVRAEAIDEFAKALIDKAYKRYMHDLWTRDVRDIARKLKEQK